MEFLDALEAEKFKKQKCIQFCWTPCRFEKIHFLKEKLRLVREGNKDSRHNHNRKKYVKLQGVPQNCTHFCFLNFSASKGSRNLILDIFQ